jgi:hypothetical protein
MATVFFSHQGGISPMGGHLKVRRLFSQCRVLRDLIRLGLGKLGSLFSALLRFYQDIYSRPIAVQKSGGDAKDGNKT